MRALGIATGFTVAVVIGLAFWVQSQINAPGPRSGSAEVLTIEVQPGTSYRTVVETLEKEQLIRSAFWLRVWAKATGASQTLKVGEYQIRTDMSAREILAVLGSGRSLQREFTISEGLNIFEIAGVVAKTGVGSREEFLRLVRHPETVEKLLGEKHSSLEGYLFPETYAYTKYTKLDDLVRVMVQRFLKVYGEIEKSSGPSKLTRHQLVTLASIVEKETGAPEERPVISSVFHNRLRIGMRLQTDPTVIYGMWAETGRALLNITRKDLTTPHAYNTYMQTGLPIGPIGNPGRESLLAAFQPAQTDYLFFVSKNAGTHFFSKTLREHELAVREYQLNPKAREGKSWRQLKSADSKK
jgi:UPF0755 protein